MYRFLLLGLIAPSTLVLAGAGLSVIDVFEGQVASTSGNRITLSSGGEEFAINVGPDTRITLDGAPGNLDDLTPDHLATVTAKRVGNEWLAISIEARSQAFQGASRSRFLW